jgi:catalase
MATSYSTLNFDGQLRTDANHGHKPQYAPNSFGNRFRPDAAETPYVVSDPTVSRQSHFFHEGKPSEYDQPRELYRRVMTDEGRKHLHSNTARCLKFVEFEEIQVKYLAQQYAIAPEYARGVYDLLPEKKFDFKEVERRAVGAEVMGKEKKFRPSKSTGMLTGLPPKGAVYNV